MPGTFEATLRQGTWYVETTHRHSNTLRNSDIQSHLAPDTWIYQSHLTDTWYLDLSKPPDTWNLDLSKPPGKMRRLWGRALASEQPSMSPKTRRTWHWNQLSIIFGHASIEITQQKPSKSELWTLCCILNNTCFGWLHNLPLSDVPIEAPDQPERQGAEM